MKLLGRLVIACAVVIGLLVMHGVGPVHAASCPHDHHGHNAPAIQEMAVAHGGQHEHADTTEIVTEPENHCGDSDGVHGCTGMVRKSVDLDGGSLVTSAWQTCEMLPPVAQIVAAGVANNLVDKPNLNLLGISLT